MFSAWYDHGVRCLSIIPEPFARHHRRPYISSAFFAYGCRPELRYGSTCHKQSSLAQAQQTLTWPRRAWRCVSFTFFPGRHHDEVQRQAQESPAISTSNECPSLFGFDPGLYHTHAFRFWLQTAVGSQNFSSQTIPVSPSFLFTASKPTLSRRPTGGRTLLPRFQKSQPPSTSLRTYALKSPSLLPAIIHLQHEIGRSNIVDILSIRPLTPPSCSLCSIPSLRVQQSLS